MGKRTPFGFAHEFFTSNAKIASNQMPTREDLIEIGFTGMEVDRLQKQASVFSDIVLGNFLEKMAEVMTNHDMGETPLERKIDGGSTPNDHDAKDPLSGVEATALKKVEDLLAKRELQHPSGESSGKTLTQNTDFTSGGDTMMAPNGDEKLSSDESVNKILNLLA